MRNHLAQARFSPTPGVGRRGRQMWLISTAEMRKGGWRSTNPPYHATIMSQANVALDQKLKPLVRVMKWNEANSSHLESFHLEMRSGRCGMTPRPCQRWRRPSRTLSARA